MNIKKQRFEPRYKYIKNEEDLNIDSYIADFSQLPLNLVYSFNDPNDQLSIFNKTTTDCISRHAPIQKVKFTRPPAPWMKEPEIFASKNQLEHLRNLSHNDNCEATKLL